MHLFFCISGNKIIFEAEPGAQLACQLLFRLLDQSSDNPIIPLSVDKFSFEPTPDRALRYSAQENIQPCQIFAVLKAIMRFSEAESSMYSCVYMLQVVRWFR